MNTLLNNLSVRKRMMLSIFAFMATLFLSMHTTYKSINANIDFAAQEKKGNLYQRPASDALFALGGLRVALADARYMEESVSEITGYVQKIDQGFAQLKSAQAAVGEDLQFTAEGLGSRGRENLKYETMLAKWNDLSAAIKSNPRAESLDAAVVSLVGDLRGAIAHAGDTSNLILDPDLDSYYLMDVTLLALPQTLDRLAAIGTALDEYLHNPIMITEQQRTEAAVLASALQESDITRVMGSMDTALKEDVNFYGVHQALQDNIPPALKKYEADNARVVALLQDVAAGRYTTVEEMKSVIMQAHDAAKALLDVSLDELDMLLDIRLASYQRDQQISLLIAIAGIILSFLFFLVVVRSLTVPLQKLTEAMESLADDKLDVDVPYQGVKSELGNIAASLQIFKNSALEKAKIEEDQKQNEQRTKEERKTEMNRVAQSFESRVKGIIDALSSSASGLSSTANDMARFVGESAESASEASEKASETSQNMQSVAAAAEEMAVTIQEISSQVQNTNRFIEDSVQKANGAGTHAESLKAASQRVKDVISLIAEIANQTNLLALNATIEAARAGEAGKGFAVVATEVKNLASQTDKSIQDIERVINEMSQATDGVVTSLGGIKDAVDRIYETSSGIASAVEEQSATVNDIVKNMQTASSGTVVVSENVAVVTKLSGEASQSSQQVLIASNDLNERATQLDQEVAAFLSEVRSGN